MNAIKRVISSFRTLIKQKPAVGYSIIAAGILIFGGLAYAIVEISSREPREPNQTKIKPRPVTYYSPLSGVKVKDEAATKKAVTAVMIENSPESRPQSGLAQSEVVYEAIAEGGITRFLVLYQQNKPELIGPVRSIRMYYVDWYAPYNAGIAHVGGSAAALHEVRHGSYRDLDQFFNPDSYWRASDRYAPHNVYTNSSKLNDLNNKKGFKTSSFKGFARQDAPKERADTARSIAINFSSDTFNTRYSYDKKTNTYARSYAYGGAHTDREKGTIRPTVVVAMKVQMTHVMEDGYRESIKTTGSGEAIIFQNGQAIKATWKKAGRKDPLMFVNKEGKPVALNRGQTWIAAVPTSQQGGVSWK